MLPTKESLCLAGGRGRERYLSRGCLLDGFLGLVDLLLVIDREQQELAEGVTPVIAPPESEQYQSALFGSQSCMVSFRKPTGPYSMSW